MVYFVLCDSLTHHANVLTHFVRKKKISIEPVEIVYEDNRQPAGVTPDLTSRSTTAKVDYINSCTGLKLSPDEICDLLNKMSLEAAPSKEDKNEVVVQVPVTRSDVLHQCDIMEDVAIAYGFNNLPHTTPSVSTIGKPYPLNKLADTARVELALAGWSEVSPLTLVSQTPIPCVFRVQSSSKEKVRYRNVSIKGRTDLTRHTISQK